MVAQAQTYDLDITMAGVERNPSITLMLCIATCFVDSSE